MDKLNRMVMQQTTFNSDPREWTTSLVRPSERLDYWVGAICEAFLEMDCSSKAADYFDGKLIHLPLEQLVLNQVQASSQDVYRTPSAIARSRLLPFYLITQTEHVWHVVQDGTTRQLRPGDAVLIDAALPYELHFPHSVACLSVQMPRSWVSSWLQNTDTQQLRIIGREQGWGTVLSALCLQLGRQPDLALQMAPDWLEGQFGALLNAALEPIARNQSTHKTTLYQRALACMRERLDHPGLKSADLAVELGVSVRTLHRAFTEAGEMLAPSWRQLRMERAQSLLTQPRFSDLSISEIGWRCGYTDASHFARDFQRTFGQTPLRWTREKKGF